MKGSRLKGEGFGKESRVKGKGEMVKGKG